MRVKGMSVYCITCKKFWGCFCALRGAELLLFLSLFHLRNFYSTYLWWHLVRYEACMQMYKCVSWPSSGLGRDLLYFTKLLLCGIIIRGVLWCGGKVHTCYWDFDRKQQAHTFNMILHVYMYLLLPFSTYFSNPCQGCVTKESSFRNVGTFREVGTFRREITSWKIM